MTKAISGYKFQIDYAEMFFIIYFCDTVQQQFYIFQIEKFKYTKKYDYFKSYGKFCNITRELISY